MQRQIEDNKEKVKANYNRTCYCCGENKSLNNYREIHAPSPYELLKITNNVCKKCEESQNNRGL